MQRYPQVLENVHVSDRAGLAVSAAIADAVHAAESELGDSGRVLVRASGTEPLVRVMVEAAEADAGASHRGADRRSRQTELGQELGWSASPTGSSCSA